MSSNLAQLARNAPSNTHQIIDEDNTTTPPQYPNIGSVSSLIGQQGNQTDFISIGESIRLLKDYPVASESERANREMHIIMLRGIGGTFQKQSLTEQYNTSINLKSYTADYIEHNIDTYRENPYLGKKISETDGTVPSTRVASATLTSDIAKEICQKYKVEDSEELRSTINKEFERRRDSISKKIDKLVRKRVMELNVDGDMVIFLSSIEKAPELFLFDHQNFLENWRALKANKSRNVDQEKQLCQQNEIFRKSWYREFIGALYLHKTTDPNVFYSQEYLFVKFKVLKVISSMKETPTSTNNKKRKRKDTPKESEKLCIDIDK